MSRAELERVARDAAHKTYWDAMAQAGRGWSNAERDPVIDAAVQHAMNQNRGGSVFPDAGAASVPGDPGDDPSPSQVERDWRGVVLPNGPPPIEAVRRAASGESVEYDCSLGWPYQHLAIHYLRLLSPGHARDAAVHWVNYCRARLREAGIDESVLDGIPLPGDAAESAEKEGRDAQ